MSHITYQRSQSWTALAAVAVLAAVGGAAYWGLSSPSSPQREGVTLSSSATGLPGWPQASTGNPEPTEVLRPPVSSDGRPSDVSAEDWSTLQAALAKIGAPASEAERVVGYNRYQRNYDSWQSLDETKDASRRRRMASALMAELPDHVTKGEYTLIESMLIGAALIADIEPDEARRSAQLQAWQAQAVTVAPVPSEDEAKARAAARDTELKRRQAGAFATWQGLANPAERTPARLEQALEEVRRAYNAMAF